MNKIIAILMCVLPILGMIGLMIADIGLMNSLFVIASVIIVFTWIIAALNGLFYND